MEKVVQVIPARKAEAVGKEKRKLRVAAYCRVSTEQEEQLGSFANQVEYYTRLIEDEEDWELAGIYADEGISGTGTRKRKGFQRLIEACDEGRVDFVITKSISRFARNTADCLTYARLLKDRGIPILFQKESINTMEASGELMFTILSCFAQEESRSISENTKWGIRSKFQQGIPHVNTVRLFGFDKCENGQLRVSPEQSPLLCFPLLSSTCQRLPFSFAAPPLLTVSSRQPFLPRPCRWNYHRKQRIAYRSHSRWLLLRTSTVCTGFPPSEASSGSEK